MFGFLKNLLGVKAEQAMDECVRTLVEWDPKGATEAEMRSMEEQLDKLGKELALARQSYDKEAREADEIRKLYNQRLAAANKLDEMMGTATDPARRGELEKSLNSLLSMLEEMGPDIAREEQEAKDAKDFLDMVDNAYSDAGERFKSARKALEGAERDMKRAEMQKEQAKRTEDQVKRAAGIAKAGDSLGIALKSMRESADRNLAEADAAKRKTALLRPTSSETGDKNIAAALAAVSGKPDALAGGSAADRLAALRNKSAS